MKSLKVVFMGTPEFALPGLQSIYKNFNLIGCFTQPSRPSGRGQKISHSPVKNFCKKNNIPVFTPENFKEKKEIKPNPIQMANPELIWISEKKEKDEEGCLSIPGVMGEVTRPSSCKVKYLDRYGESKKLLAEGLLARCIQHEIDHINGILFIDHLSKTKKDMILRKIKKQLKENKQTT